VTPGGGIAVTAVLVIATCVVGMVDPGSVTFYEGATVVNVGRRSFGFQINGFIFRTTPSARDVFGHDADRLAHEYGHYLQQIEMGEDYVIVVVSSLILSSLGLAGAVDDAGYYGTVWEADANRRAYVSAESL